jgi:hypothetical protein
MKIQIANKPKFISGCIIFSLMLFGVLANFYTKSAELSSSSDRGWEAMKIDNRYPIY